MGSDEKRESLRVPCDYPILVHGQMGDFAGRMVNVSRTGIRMRLPLSCLDLPAQFDLATFAAAVKQALGGWFAADLHHEMLGPLVRKRLFAIRIDAPSPEAEELELGCAFEDLLSDEELAMVGIGLPAVGVTSLEAFRDVPPPRRRGAGDDLPSGQPRPLAYEGILHASDDHVADPLVGSTHGAANREILLHCPVSQIHRDADSDAATVLETLQRTFGSSPRLEILDGLRMVWSGVVQLHEIELPQEPTGNALLLLESMLSSQDS